jgi:hypothetical protein
MRCSNCILYDCIDSTLVPVPICRECCSMIAKMLCISSSYSNLHPTDLASLLSRVPQ